MWFIVLYTSFSLCTTDGECTAVTMSPEAYAIAACESGDTETLGSLDWQAVNVNVDGTVDQGAFQFNSYWIWNPADLWIMEPIANRIGMSGKTFTTLWPTPNDAPPAIQLKVFDYVWNDGYGWQNWSASQPCWSQWLRIDESGRAVFKTITTSSSAVLK